MKNLLKTRPNANDECFTPPEIFELLNTTFDLDVCAPVGGVPWIPAKHHYSIHDHGLLQPWYGRVWLNPPYSDPTPWIQRFIDHNSGIALIPTSVGKWMQKLWNAPTTWLMLTNIKFVRPDGTQYKQSLPTRVYLVAIGQDNTDILKAAGPAK